MCQIQKTTNGKAFLIYIVIEPGLMMCISLCDYL